MGTQKGGKKKGASGGKRTPKSLRRLSLRAVLLGTAVALTAVSLLVALSLPPRGTGEHRAVSSAEAPQKRSSSVDDSSIRGKGGASDAKRRRGPQGTEASASPESGEVEYEERLDPFTRDLERIDLALVQSLAQTGVDLDKLHHIRIDFREKGNREYRFQEIELRVRPHKGRRVVQELKRLLGKWLPDASLESAAGAPWAWRVRVKDVVTHRIALGERKEGQQSAGLGNGPRIALVMDDMGNSLRRARQLLRLSGGDIALSVLPCSPYSEEVARAAKERGADVLLHLPMEPKGYPETDPGPGALFVSMGPERIRSVLKRDMERVPGLVGVNNHMGSRFTAEEFPMRQVLSVLRRRGLFYMDSLTSPDSVGAQLASSLGLRTIKRDLFLDNEKSVASIRYQLRKAEHVARECGHAVVIGHPYPQTISALRQWLANKDENVRLCRLSRLVQAQNEVQATRRKTDGTTDAGDY